MYIKYFSEISKNDTSLAGGKGASLAEMAGNGFPVPPGFVIVASAFEKFLIENGLTAEIEAILEKVDHDDTHTIENASESIRTLLLNAPVPADIRNEILKNFEVLDIRFVAVRSSATAEDSVSAAWAGQLESYLNTTEASLLENVKKCWASLFTARAIFYRFEKGLRQEKISVAVVVQKMVESEKSGIAFSVHPVTEDKNQLIIEAGFGLGEAIVSGQITPDSYVVLKSQITNSIRRRGQKNPKSEISKQKNMILEKNIHPQTKALRKNKKGGNTWQSLDNRLQNEQKLSDSDIVELAQIVIKLEEHYGFPVDVEWAYEKGKFYMVQSRPITTLTGKAKTTTYFKKEDYILSFWARGVSVFVTDIHVEAYRALEVLYMIDHGMFKQYFTKKAYEQALDRGLAFYSHKSAFNDYQKDLSLHCDRFKAFFASEIIGKETLSQKEVILFFEYTKKLCGDYAKMNFESTDKAFMHQDKNPIIRKNLLGVAAFKDVVRAFMNTVLFETGGYSNQLFTILGKQFQFAPSLFDHCTQQEILDLFTGNTPLESSLVQRPEAFVESYNLDRFCEGKDAETILQEFKEEVSYSDVIQGQVASPGKVSGTVKVIPVDYSDLDRVHAEIDKMKPGDILVAETTAPELMIACKKAGAIVTDMGGLMSHAAIVARELGKPCIVGTKSATKVLSDGDLVEVNAGKGIVKILRKAS